MRPSAHMDQTPSRSRPGDSPAGRRRSRRARIAARIPAVFLVIPLLAGLVGGPVAPVGADELSDAKSRQAQLAQQLKNQREAVAQINALQADLSIQIASTRKQLTGITADLATVKTNINAMIVKIGIVKGQYLALVAQVELLDTQLTNLKTTEMRARWHLQETKDLLAERLRDAY